MQNFPYEKFAAELERCVGGLYIIDDETCEITWANEYITKRYGNVCGKACHQVFNNNADRCEFCPRNIPAGETYSWDYYDSKKKKWMKIKNRVCEQNGRKYRISNVNSVNDIMQLNREAMSHMAFLQKLLLENEHMKTLLEWEVGHDGMTELFNRGQFLKDIETIYFRAEHMGVVYYDVNNLKTVNDVQGHRAGDLLIKKLARALDSVSDKNVRCYRLGGDEFAVITTEIDRERLEAIPKAVQAHIDRLNAESPIPHCSVSYGITYEEANCNIEDLVKAADNEMYTAKKASKNAGH